MEFKQALLYCVQKIPYWRVAYYGQIAIWVSDIVGKNIGPRIIWRQMSALKPETWQALCPWWRVVAKTGQISSLKLWPRWAEQIRLLEAEWIPLLENKVPMDIFCIDTNLFLT